EQNTVPYLSKALRDVVMEKDAAAIACVWTCRRTSFGSLDEKDPCAHAKEFFYLELN
ncbi:hypothetical protein SOVF_088500, partial [Spinacia oleracea]